jgi:hypothetical protein
MYACNKQEFCQQNNTGEFPVSSLLIAGRKKKTYLTFHPKQMGQKDLLTPT